MGTQGRAGGQGENEMTKSKQSGMTLIGFIFVILIAGFFAYMALKLVPSYTQFFGVTKAMHEVATEGVDGKDKNTVRRDFMFKLSFQYADEVIKPQNIKFIRHEDGTDMQVKYDDQVHFVYNIDFLLHFEKTVKLNGSLN